MGMFNVTAVVQLTNGKENSNSTEIVVPKYPCS